ncbi:hypothetical protein ACTQ6A_13965 [Lachnospiraceae bacterium LCP25S3_G4]
MQKAREKEKEERLFQQWLTFLPRMDKKTYVSFQEYFESATGKNIDKRNKEEIIQEIKILHGMEV